mmetsp:Transcript_22854/g.20323  ORF Transcript_22854/g.20323 Transcript_22854/m.20323 type:complete len:114 (-) Transcript_22854:304-645(-)
MEYIQKIYDTVQSELKNYKELCHMNENEIGRLRTVIEVEQKYCREMEGKLNVDIRKLKYGYEQQISILKFDSSEEVLRMEKYQKLLKKEIKLKGMVISKHTNNLNKTIQELRT